MPEHMPYIDDTPTTAPHVAAAALAEHRERTADLIDQPPGVRRRPPGNADLTSPHRFHTPESAAATFRPTQLERQRQREAERLEALRLDGLARQRLQAMRDEDAYEVPADEADRDHWPPSPGRLPFVEHALEALHEPDLTRRAADHVADVTADAIAEELSRPDPDLERVDRLTTQYIAADPRDPERILDELLAVSAADHARHQRAAEVVEVPADALRRWVGDTSARGREAWRLKAETVLDLFLARYDDHPSDTPF